MPYNIKLKRPNEQESVLIIEFMKNGRRFKFYSGKTIQTVNWNQKRQMVRESEENFIHINHYLESWERELRRIVEEMESKRIRLDREVIKKELDRIFKRGIEENRKEELDFITFYDKFIESHLHYTSGSVSILRQNRKHVICAMKLATKEQIREHHNKPTRTRGQINLKAIKKLPFEQINEEFLDQFISYLRSAKFTGNIRGVEVELNYKKNYIAKHIKQLKQVVRASFKKHTAWFDMGGEEYKAKFEDVDSVYTDFDELQSLVDLDLDGREKIVRDKYVLNCFLGMRFSDLSRIKPHHFKSRIIEGKTYVIYSGRQIKTDNTVEFPIHNNAVRILEEYQYQLPAMTDDEFNILLKIIAMKAGLTGLFTKRETRGNLKTEYNEIPKYQLMSSHTGRRSFCTNYKVAGWDIQSIMAVSGHKTEEEFLKYVKAGAKLEVLVNQLDKIPELRMLKMV